MNTITFYVIPKSNDLMHYGVKGMKWGVRHDPRRIGRRKATGKAVVDKHTKRKGLSRKQKIAIGVVAGTAVLAATGVVLYKTGSFDKLLSKGKSAVVNDIRVKTKEKVASGAKEISSKIKPINKRCNYNSFAAVLSKKFNISLKPDGPYEGNVTAFLSRALKNPDKHIFDTIPKEVYRDETRLSSTIMRIAKNQEGAEGQVCSNLSNGLGGHAFNWKIEGGVVKYYDTHAQIKSGAYDAIEDASSYIRDGYINGVNGKITRLDNIEKEDLVMEYLKDKFNIT